ncbi:MAG TPA: class I SAM-dependent methyltransferase [Thermoanaerobaculia bacterium]|nr:class I SAM-dependent methyltransferase [Thermoanaerobaculia bacterium]
MPNCRYTSDEPMWSNDYLWPALVRILDRIVPPPSRLFELGCGNGATARMLAGRGYAVTAVDPSASGIALAKRHESDELRFAIGSTNDDLAARYGTFPAVVSMEVIEHCPSSRDFMESFLSLIAPGGIGILSTPYHGYLKNLAVVALGRFDSHFDPLWEGGHVKFFTLAKLRQLFARSNVSHYEFHRIGRLPMFAKSVIAVVGVDGSGSGVKSIFKT